MNRRMWLRRDDLAARHGGDAPQGAELGGTMVAAGAVGAVALLALVTPRLEPEPAPAR